MKVIKNGSGPKVDRTDAPIFYGGKVTGQSIVGGDDTKFYNFNLVSFAAGAKNHFHTHTVDQILFVTEGTGIVANESGEQVITVGDTGLKLASVAYSVSGVWFTMQYALAGVAPIAMTTRARTVIAIRFMFRTQDYLSPKRRRSVRLKEIGVNFVTKTQNYALNEKCIKIISMV